MQNQGKYCSRWIEALNLVAHGCSSKQVAGKMGISTDAVTKHLERAREKMRAKTTTEAVYKAAKSGLIAVLIAASIVNNGCDFTRINRQSRQRVSVRTARLIRLQQRHLTI